MVKIKKYKSGKRVYTHWDKKVEQVTVYSKKKSKQKKEKKELKIHLSDMQPEANMINLFRVTHTKEEFIFDFFNAKGAKAKLVSRVIVAPGTAKKLINALKKEIKNYDDINHRRKV